MSHLGKVDNKVISTQGREIVSFFRGTNLTAGNSFSTLAKIPGSLHSMAGLMRKPALRPEFSFMPIERNSLSTKRICFARSDVRGLPIPTQVSPEPPVPGTVSFFN